MAQAGYTPIQLYYSTTAAAVPTAGNLNSGELAINITDGKLYYKSNAGVVLLLASNATSAPVLSFQTSLGGLTPSTATTGVVTLAGTLNTSSGGTGLSSYTAGDLSYYASGTALTKLAIGTAGQILTSSGTAPQWSTLSGVAVTTFSAGTTGFTPSSATAGAVTLAGTLATTNGGTGLTSFTSGGVVYASSSSALATGSTFTFNGTVAEITAGNTGGVNGFTAGNSVALGYAALTLKNTGASGKTFEVGVGGNGTSGNYQNNLYIRDTSGNPTFYVNSTGIGAIGKIEVVQSSNFPTVGFSYNSNGYLYTLGGTSGTITQIAGVNVVTTTSTGLGIGNTPSALLDVGPTTSASSPAAILRGGSGLGNTGGLGLYTQDGSANARNWAVVANSTVYGDFAIRQGSALFASPFSSGTDRFYISLDGKIAIGNNIAMWANAYGGALFLKGDNSTSNRFARLCIADSTGALIVNGLTITSSGNASVGITGASDWLWPDSSTGAFQLQAGAAFTGYNAGAIMSQNYFYNSGEKFIDNGYAERYIQTTGLHIWQTSTASNSSGAGASLSWTDVGRFTAAGQFLVGSNTAAGSLGSGTIQVGSGHGGITNTGSIAPSVIMSGALEFNLDGVSGSQRHGRIIGTGDTTGGAYAGGLTLQYYAYDGSTTYQWFTGININSGGVITAPATYNNVSGGSPNMFVQTDGTFYRGTSALKYKQDIRDLELIDINKFRAVRYKSLCKSDDQTIDYFGLIADDVDAAGVKELVTYGPNGEVENFQYDRFTMVLLKEVQAQKAIIESLKARLDAANL